MAQTHEGNGIDLVWINPRNLADFVAQNHDEMGIEMGSVEEWVFPYMFPKNFLHFLSPLDGNFWCKIVDFQRM